MSIYLGYGGEIELRREFDGSEITATVKRSDVNATRDRLSFEFKRGQLLSGDQIRITSTNNAALAFFTGYTKNSRVLFINVDDLGGIRFYTSFSAALNGSASNAVDLADISADIPIKVQLQNADFRVLAQVTNYELNTQRDVVDTTTLSEDFRSQLSSLMSGSGSMTCIWEYADATEKELSNYLLNLILRTKVGSIFRGKFYVKRPDGPFGRSNDTIWYEFDGVLTQCALQFLPDSVVKVAADFVTTGEIALKTKLLSTDALLQEDSDDILLDLGEGNPTIAKLMLESADT